MKLLIKYLELMKNQKHVALHPGERMKKSLKRSVKMTSV